MRIAEFGVPAFIIGSMVGAILMGWLSRRGDRLISNVKSLISEIGSRVETLADSCDLTPAQRKRMGPPNRVAHLDEFFDYYQWAIEVGLDPIAGSALAIICEKFLGLTRRDALRAMRQAKRADDYKRC